MYSSTHSNALQYMDISAQLQTPIAFTSGQEPVVPIELEAGRDPETAELTNSLRTWSGTLRELLHSACADECEKITGARLMRSASNIVGTDTWDKSTIMPSRFISRTTN